MKNIVSSHHGIARNVRKRIITLAHKVKTGHLGSAFSIVDILTVLYHGILRCNPDNSKDDARDRLILSKGHGALALYAMLENCGFFSEKDLDTYLSDGSVFAAHATFYVPGVEFSTGSLGHGLSAGVGMALAAKYDHKNHRIFVILSDGECDEGAIWEAALAASHFKLDNLVVVVDYNKIQAFGRVKDVLNLEPFAEKWKSFGWEVREVDGHHHGGLRIALQGVPFREKKPNVLIAHTIKGKGVSFMEDTIEWHYHTPTDDHLKTALEELDESNMAHEI